MTTALRLSEGPSLVWDDCRVFLESVPHHAMFVVDADGRVATWNLGAERVLGYRADEIVGLPFATLYADEDRAAEAPVRDLRVAAGVGGAEGEGWRVRRDGEAIWARTRVAPLRGDGGTVRGYTVVVRDLGEERRTETRIVEAEARFHHLIDSVTDYAIFMLDADGHVRTWNAGAMRAKGYAPDEIIGKHFSVFYTPEDQASGLPGRILDVVRRTGHSEQEGWRIRKDGSRFWANVVVSALHDEEGALVGFTKVTRDLSERRAREEELLRAERELIREQAARAAAESSERIIRESEQAARHAARRAEEAAEQAETANRLKDDFLATVSHELRTPLNAIVGWSNVLLDRHAAGGDPSVTKGLEVIQRNAHSQSQIIEDILDMSRIITGKLRLALASTTLLSVTNEAIEAVAPSAKARGIAVELLPASDPVALLADADRLRQVVWNLLSNAVKFTDSGGHVVVRIEHHGNEASVSVRDTGRGIERDFLPQVFERFKQADSSTTRRFGGLGLGLAIVRQVVELHGGHVHAESGGKGQGSLFRFSIPVRTEEEAPRPPEPPAVARPPAGGRRSAPRVEGLRVLVVDDDPDARDLLKHVLVAAGAVVEAAESAAAGLEKVRSFRPHVLVSDIGMPGEDGYSLVRRVQSLDITEGGAIPSIALTAYTRIEDRNKALAAGFTTHIGKPVNPDDLIAAVENLGRFMRR